MKIDPVHSKSVRGTFRWPVYHDDDSCPKLARLRPENRLSGTDGRARCSNCQGIELGRHSAIQIGSRKIGDAVSAGRERFRAYATESRIEAERATDPAAIRILLDIADSYDRLVATASRAGSGRLSTAYDAPVDDSKISARVGPNRGGNDDDTHA